MAYRMHYRLGCTVLVILMLEYQSIHMLVRLLLQHCINNP